jgi:hypothetical protein
MRGWKEATVLTFGKSESKLRQTGSTLQAGPCIPYAPGASAQQGLYDSEKRQKKCSLNIGQDTAAQLGTQDSKCSPRNSESQYLCFRVLLCVSENGDIVSIFLPFHRVKNRSYTKDLSVMLNS